MHGLSNQRDFLPCALLTPVPCCEWVYSSTPRVVELQHTCKATKRITRPSSYIVLCMPKANRTVIIGASFLYCYKCVPSFIGRPSIPTRSDWNSGRSRIHSRSNQSVTIADWLRLESMPRSGAIKSDPTKKILTIFRHIDRFDCVWMTFAPNVAITL